MKKARSVQEYTLYLLVWLLLAISPLFVSWLQILSGNQEVVDWSAVVHAWAILLPFLLVFILHDLVLAPLLVYRKRRWLYLMSTAAVVAIFVVYQCSIRPRRPHFEGRPDRELGDKISSRSPFSDANGPEGRDGNRPDDFGERQGEMGAEGPLAMGDAAPGSGGKGKGPAGRGKRRGEERSGSRPNQMEGPHRPPVIVGQHDVISAIVLMLMIALNLSVKYYYKHREEVEKLEALEMERVQQQLAYLRYQINPHFLMNTLNNIHSLIDVEPETAQSSIVELSRLLRYVLYEGDHHFVPVQREVDFLHHYIELMRIRCSENVDIRFNVKMVNSSLMMPPLLLATFVENAFKYGVSAQHASFVHISIDAGADRLFFECSNSKQQRTGQVIEEGGLGLRNARQRLDLLFPDEYSLAINDGTLTYEVQLDLPLQDSSQLDNFKLPLNA